MLRYREGFPYGVLLSFFFNSFSLSFFFYPNIFNPFQRMYGVGARAVFCNVAKKGFHIQLNKIRLPFKYCFHFISNFFRVHGNTQRCFVYFFFSLCLKVPVILRSTFCRFSDCHRLGNTDSFLPEVSVILGSFPINWEC